MRIAESGVEVYLNEVLALGFSDQRLKFGSSEGVDETRLGDDKQ
jgi:hypothetical protein